MIERPGWMQIITPSIKTGNLNEVLFSALDADGADRVIDAAIAEYCGLGLKFQTSRIASDHRLRDPKRPGIEPLVH